MAKRIHLPQSDLVVDSLKQFMSRNTSALPVAGAIAAMGIGAVGAYYVSKNSYNQKLTPPVDLKDQTVPSPDGSGGRMNRLLEKDKKCLECLFPDATTLYETFRRGAKQSEIGECLGERRIMPDGTQPYVWMSYDEVIRRSEDLAAAFCAKGIDIGQDTFIGIYSQNRPEWILIEQACYCYSMVVVPLYDTLGPDACSYIIERTSISLVVCDKNSKAQSLLSQKQNCPTLRLLVVIEELSESVKKLSAEQNVEVLSFKEFERIGRENVNRPPVMPPKPEDLSTICFTSGTTGTPKGVMLTHGNIVADLTPWIQFKNVNLTQNDTMISFLPLAHMFERMLENICFMIGARVGFYRGDIKLLTEDIKELRPSLVPVVPRLLNRIYDKVMQEVNKSGFKKYLFDWGLRSKTSELKKSVVRNNSIWDKVLFKRVREGMGGRVKLMITGSAPCSAEVLTFMRAAMGCVIVEGYGQTECVACATVTFEGDHTPGQVGPPAVCVEIKLADVPEMGYFCSQEEGEVCIRGPTVFKGYYKDEDRTKEVLDDEGWLHTGDIGQWTESGTLKIFDRKKHIFKLSQGEYIAPEKIENVYLRSRYVAQAFVYGESLKSCLVAIIVPDSEVLPKAVVKELGLRGKSMEELCQNSSVKKLILDDITKTGNNSGLHSFEQVKDIHLCSEVWTVDNNLLTPTLKTKRPELKKLFEKEIARMYSSLV